MTRHSSSTPRCQMSSCIRPYYFSLLTPSNNIILPLFLSPSSLPTNGRISDPGSLSRLFSPLPTTSYGVRLHFYRENTSALSPLVDSHRGVPVSSNGRNQQHPTHSSRLPIYRASKSIRPPTKCRTNRQYTLSWSSVVIFNLTRWLRPTRPPDL